MCTAPRFATPPDERLVELAQRHLRARPLELEVRKMAPDAGGTMRKIAEDARTEPGWALARIGDGGWWPAIERGLGAGRMDDEIVVALADVVRGAGAPVAWVTRVPSVAVGATLDDLAPRLAAELGVPYVDLVARTEARPPQRELANAVQQAANVRGAFAITGSVPPGAGVLVDDRRLSGWTLAMVGGQLRLAGATAVTPVVLATLG